MSGFYLAFMPLYVIGLLGFMRRTSHYENTAFQPYLIIAFIGAVLILIGVVFQVMQFVYSIKNRKKLVDKTGDPWDGRTLEWSISSPAPFYNFAHIPEVSTIDPFWEQKQQEDLQKSPPKKKSYTDIHMPKNTPDGFYISLCSGVLAFALIWHMLIPGVVSFLGILFFVIRRTSNTDTDYYVPASEVQAIEEAHLGGKSL